MKHSDHPGRHSATQTYSRLALPFAADAAFSAVFGSSGEALVIATSAGLIQRANSRARVLLQLEEATVRGTKLGEFLDSPKRDHSVAVWAQLFTEARVPTLDAVLPTGLPVRFILRSVMPGSGDLLICVEETVIDQRLDEKWMLLEAKLLQTDKMAALGHLVSSIAHELNNPLTAILGYAQLLLGHGLAPAHRSEADKVYQEAERARRIVKNLLYFARENKTERTRMDLNEIVERTLALRSYELKVENIFVDYDLDRGLPMTMADPYQLQQVVLNLVVNAEQALLEARGQGRVRIRTSHSVELGSERIRLEISDDGPGIPPANASRVFDPFFTTKPPGVGTGLGLSIVYGIVHQHGGEVTFENQPGSGAKFIVDLPVVSVISGETAAAAPFRIDRDGDIPAGRILIVEDEPTVAQLIVDVLVEEGHYAEAVLDSQEGLTRISRNNFDLVICDLRMPRLDGQAFYAALVRAGSPVSNKILFITGDTLARRTVEFLEPNGFPYLAKPFLVEELKLSVNRLLVAGRLPMPAGPHASAITDRQSGPKS